MYRKNCLCVVPMAVVMLLSFADRAAAALITLTNPSFENPALGDGGFAGGSNPGWASASFGASTGRGTWNPDGTFFTGATGNGTPLGADGSNVYTIYGATLNSGGRIYQDTTTSLTAGTMYTLTAALGRRASGDAVNWGIDLMTTSQALNGTGMAAEHLARITGTPGDLTAGQFVDKTVSFTPTAGDPNLGQNLRVHFWTDGTGVGGQTSVGFDNVRLDATGGVPPPPPTLYDDFATDPDLATDWTHDAHYGTVGTATWNAGDQDLDLTAGTSNRWSELRRTGSSRGATDPVTLEIGDLSASGPGNDWALAGLMISQAQTPGLTGADPRYIFDLITGNGGADWRYDVRRDSNMVLYASPTIPAASLTFPIRLDIERDGADYVFMANGSELYRSSYYAPAVQDSLQYYHITWGSGQGVAMTATVDNFGVPAAAAGDIPEPATMALLGLAACGLGGYVRRRRTA